MQRVLDWHLNEEYLLHLIYKTCIKVSIMLNIDASTGHY